MEMEFFVVPGTDEEWHEYWLKSRWDWYLDLGLKEENLRFFGIPRRSCRTTPSARWTSSTAFVSPVRNGPNSRDRKPDRLRFEDPLRSIPAWTCRTSTRPRANGGFPT